MRKLILLLITAIIATSCETTQTSRALYASCEQMKVLAERDALPVLYDDQLELRVELTEIIYSELVAGEADAPAGTFTVSALPPCNY